MACAAVDYVQSHAIIIPVSITIKSKIVPYSITSVGHRADPGFLAVSPHVTLVVNSVVGCRYFPPGPQYYSRIPVDKSQHEYTNQK